MAGRGLAGTPCSLPTCPPGSSSSALGLQSLGLSGQAPSSSSLDAGTLSDTTASGNCPQRGVRPRPQEPQASPPVLREPRAAALTGHSGLPASALALEMRARKAQRCSSAKTLWLRFPRSACCLASADSPTKARRAACRLISFRAEITAFRLLHQSSNI